MQGLRAFHPSIRYGNKDPDPSDLSSAPRCYTMPISETDKDRIISVWLGLHNYSKAAELLGMDRKTVRRWVMRWVEGESMRRRHGGGRKPLLSHEAREMAVELLHSKMCGTTKEAAAQLHAQGLTEHVVSVPTITRGIRKHGQEGGKSLHAARGQPRKRLSLATQRKRLACALSNRSRDWGKVLFTDRKRFPFRYPGVAVRRCEWLEKREERSASAFNHPQSLNLYAGMSMHGITEPHLVEGTSRHGPSKYLNQQGQPARNITTSEYADVLNSTLLPGGERMFTAHGVRHWVLQQDNDPSHSKAVGVVEQYNARCSARASVLPAWPPNSPDLNPIENLWGWVDAEVDALGCKSFDAYSAAVLHQLATVPRTLLRSLVDSMPRRIAEVIRLEGGKTKY
jgi:transposase